MNDPASLGESEIDLKECARVVVKRRKMIFLIFLLSLLSAVAVDLVSPQSYQIAATIQIGSIDEPLISKEDAKAYIVNQNALLSVIRQLGLSTSVEKLQKNIQTSDIEGTHLLKIRVSYPDRETVRKINNALIEPFIALGSAMYQKRLGIIVARLKELDDEIDRTSKSIASTEALVAGLYKVDPASQNDASLKIVLLQNTLSGYENHLNYLRNQRHELMLLIDHSKDFMIFDVPAAPQNPAGSSKNFILIASLAGLFLGLFSAFSAEYLQKNREV